MSGSDLSLLPGEQVIWEGRRTRRRLLRASDAFLVPFSLFFFAFSIFWEAGAAGFLSDHPHPAATPTFLVPGGVFVLLGAYLAVGRFVVRAIAGRRTRYVITDRRLVVIGGPSGTRVRTAYLHALPPPVVKDGVDGCGSIAFGAFPTATDGFSREGGARFWSDEPSLMPVLWDIAEVRRVADLVATTQSQRPSLHGGV